jgi:NAD(P)-dependent dehydrogenase (short-subunit alcohol dehydrogenase family)
MEIRGRTAVVTGAAAGTGRAIAQRLATEGAIVVLADIDREAGERTAARSAGDSCAPTCGRRRTSRR